MIERICPKCRVPMNGDKCIKPNCGCATKMSSTIYWCDDCNVPIFENICPSCGNKGRYIATDMRPVFPEENVLISLILGDNPQKYQESSVWFGSGMYIIDGKKVRLSITKLNSLPLDKIHKLKEKYEAFVTKINYCFFDEYIRKFIKANADRYNFITEEAVQFVQKYREKYAIEDMMVSFSGGKDSTVTSHIVNRALGTNKVLHIFGDTTLEFPYTLEYKKRFKKNEESRGVRVLTAKNREKNFEDLCDIVGPPSRVMRWCCTVFKTGAIQKTISSAFKDKNNILSFQGIRHSESVSRSKYERESESPKISKQTVASPIIDWIDYDVWLYILTTGIDFNEAYRLGWTRVGCWCCPNNGGWSEFLAKEVGVYDAQDIQKKINEQCLQMNPVVRPLITVVEKENKKFVSAEIPGIDLADRPCYYQGRGRLKGSYTRIGDSDEPMTEYEIYSYEAYRRKYQDDIREVPRVTLMSLDQEELNRYVELLKRGKQRLATLDNESIYELMSIKRGEKVTLSATLLFSPYPQAYFPQLCITAIVIPGRTIGSLGDMVERFSDNQRIEGTIPEMLDEALLFVKRNMRTKTIISPTTGRRTDRTDYPITAVREAIINALVHRDYSIHTEGMPIQLIMFEDRIEIHNPGGLYGRITIDQLGKIQPDTRNQVLASALETLGITENRYSGIPTIRMEMEKYNLRQPEFLDERGSFIVKLYKESKNDYEDMSNDEETNNLIVFCKTPRTRKEICDYLGLNSVTYAIQTYVNPLVEAGVIKLSIPDKPKSPKQLYYSVEREE